MVSEPDHRFLFFLVETFGKPPSDPFYEEMDVFEKLWLYESWINKLEQESKIKRSMAILTGGFSNPELAQKLMKLEQPDYTSTDDEFEDSWNIVKESAKKETRKQKRKRRKKKIDG